MIYFIQQREFVKIGYSKTPKKRISEIQTSVPERLKVLMILEGDLEYEKKLHKKFNKYTSFGEWFLFSNEIESFILNNSKNDVKNKFYKTSNNWHDRFKQMKKELGYTNKDISEITELNYNSVKNQTQPNKDLPKWLKLTIVVFERMS